MFVRFVRFNVVGAMGVAVQLAVLMLLVTGLGVHYLPATAVAIELSVLHNFLWHERWTWRDRTGSAKCKVHNAECRRHNAEGTMHNAECSMQSAECNVQSAGCGVQGAECATHVRSRWLWAIGVAPVFSRLVMFHAGNGLVSMVGSLALMPVFVTALGLHYILANLATIAATGSFNFLLGDRLIFRRPQALGRA